MQNLQQTIDAAWERRTELSPDSGDAPLRDAVATVISDLDAGRRRVAEKRGSDWVTHQWLKKAVLLSFRLSDNAPIGLASPSAPFRFYDKVATKFAQRNTAINIRAAGVRKMMRAVSPRESGATGGIL